MVLFTRLTTYADYLGHVMPGLIVTGLGLGLIFAPAIASATAHVEPRDAGAASALVNTTQQIGGSLGTALLNTIAVGVTMRALRTHGRRRRRGASRDPARLLRGVLVGGGHLRARRGAHALHARVGCAGGPADLAPAT